MSERTEARVVSVIDHYRCVINWGSDDEVGLGDRFIIYGLGDRLKDPETGEDLGLLEIVRGKGKVTHIQPRLATLETYEREALPGKRIIRRNPIFSMGGLGDQIEEVGQTEQSMLQGAEVGDYARPI
jgi:hypothetical protein